MAEKPKKKEEQAEVEVIEAESDPPVQVKNKVIMKRRRKGDNKRRMSRES